jgi:tetratricopeptide (TPR) repeat protein
MHVQIKADAINFVYGVNGGRRFYKFQTIWLNKYKKPLVIDIITIINRLGLSDYEKSLQYLQKTVELNKIVKDTALTINILFDRVQAFELSYELDSALVDSYKAFTFCTQANKLDLAAKGLFHIGYVNKLKKDYPRALKYLEKSLDILPFTPYNELRMMIYKELGDIYQKIGNTKDAISI